MPATRLPGSRPWGHGHGPWGGPRAARRRTWTTRVAARREAGGPWASARARPRGPCHRALAFILRTVTKRRRYFYGGSDKVRCVVYSVHRPPRKGPLAVGSGPGGGEPGPGGRRWHEQWFSDVRGVYEARAAGPGIDSVWEGMRGCRGRGQLPSSFFHGWGRGSRPCTVESGGAHRLEQRSGDQPSTRLRRTQ